MRLRILTPMLTLLAVAAVLAVLPLLALVSEDRGRDLVTSRAAVLDRMAALARTAEDGGGPEALQRYLDRHHQLHGESAVVIGEDGEEVAGAGEVDVRAAVAREVTTAYGYSLPPAALDAVVPWSPDVQLMSVPVEVDAIGGGAAVLLVDLVPARADVRAAWAGVVAAVLAVVTALTAGALVVVRWVLRPVAELDRAAHDVADDLAGGAAPRPPGAVRGPPELRRLAVSFREVVSALASALRQQSDLLAHTSHNLRNPLAAVRLRVDLLSHSAPDEVREQLRGVQDDLDRLDGLVEGLLVLAQAEHEGARRRAAELAGSDGSDAVGAVGVGSHLLDPAHVADRWRDRAALTSAQVVPAGGPVVVAVPPRDAEVVTDALLDNALKYGGPGARVLVEVSGAAAADGRGRAVLVVDDDGPGLAPEDLARAHDRFWRSAQHAQEPGTGLGLAIVRAVAAAHGGVLVVGTSPRGGLRVEVHLPAAPAVEEAAEVTLTTVGREVTA